MKVAIVSQAWCHTSIEAKGQRRYQVLRMECFGRISREHEVLFQEVEFFMGAILKDESSFGLEPTFFAWIFKRHKFLPHAFFSEVLDSQRRRRDAPFNAVSVWFLPVKLHRLEGKDVITAFFS